MNASTRSWMVSDRGLPTPWQITDGPLLAETMVDGRAWVFKLEVHQIRLALATAAQTGSSPVPRASAYADVQAEATPPAR